MSRMLITGIGSVSPVGIGKEQIWDAVKNGYSAIGKSNRFPSMGDVYCGEIGEMAFDEYIKDGRFRRAANISKYALVAGSLAINDARKESIRGDRTTMIMGITHGALNYTQSFHKSLIKEGVNTASPLFFSDSVLNAPAGNAAICFDIKGPVHTILGDNETALKSIMIACGILKRNVADKALVVSSEELNELSFFCRSQKGIKHISEGSGAVLIEKEERIRNISPYCCVAGMASQYNPSHPDEAFIEVIVHSLEKAHLRPEDIDLVMTASSMPVKSPLRHVPVASIVPFVGNAFAVTAMWHIILSALAIKNGKIPGTVIADKYSMPQQIRNIVICSFAKEGIASAIILSRYL